jgi:hypothetical protein
VGQPRAPGDQGTDEGDPMSPFFDELESQLRSAAKSVAGAPDVPRARRRRRPWWPGGAEFAPVVATVVVVVLVVGAALLLLRGGHPQPTPPSASPPPNGGLAALIEKTPQKQLRREFSYIAAATKDVLNSHVCAVQQPTGVTFVRGTPDPTLLSILGVLRRPATSADRLSTGVFVGTPDVYAGSVRRAFSAAGETYYLAVAPFDRAASIPSDRCFALETRALAQYLPKIPRAVRAPTQTLQAGYIAYIRNLFARAPRDGVCLVEVGRGYSGASCGTTATQIEEGGGDASDDNGVFTGIVPDGVARVTLSFPATSSQPSHSVTGIVRGNVYTIPDGGASPSVPRPTVTWLSARRRVIKTIPVPTQAQERAACQKVPVTCALVEDSTPMVSTGSTTITGQLRAERVRPPTH